MFCGTTVEEVHRGTDPENLITEANSVFPNSFMLTRYQRTPANLRPDELLTQYLVAKLRGLYDPRSNDQDNLSRIITNLDMASAKIDEVRQCFQELRQASPA